MFYMLLHLQLWSLLGLWHWRKAACLCCLKKENLENFSREKGHQIFREGIMGSLGLKCAVVKAMLLYQWLHMCLKFDGIIPGDRLLNRHVWYHEPNRHAFSHFTASKSCWQMGLNVKKYAVSKILETIHTKLICYTYTCVRIRQWNNESVWSVAVDELFQFISTEQRPEVFGNFFHFQSIYEWI